MLDITGEMMVNEKFRIQHVTIISTLAFIYTVESAY